jgi:hypothetical protein
VGQKKTISTCDTLLLLEKNSRIQEEKSPCKFVETMPLGIYGEKITTEDILPVL